MQKRTSMLIWKSLPGSSDIHIPRYTVSARHTNAVLLDTSSGGGYGWGCALTTFELLPLHLLEKLLQSDGAAVQAVPALERRLVRATVDGPLEAQQRLVGRTFCTHRHAVSGAFRVLVLFCRKHRSLNFPLLVPSLSCKNGSEKAPFSAPICFLHRSNSARTFARCAFSCSCSCCSLHSIIANHNASL
eukprot:COSAG06_NODE_4842_length_3915_cov_2.264413_3_plen_188_part_00